MAMAGTRGTKKPAQEDPVKGAASAEPENAKLTLAQKKRLKKKQREAAKKIERYVLFKRILPCIVSSTKHQMIN